MAIAEQVGEGPSSYQHAQTTGDYGASSGTMNNQFSSEFSGTDRGFQNTVNARVVENM